MICEICREKHADIVFKTVTGNQVATKAMCMACAQTIQQDMMKMFMSLGFRQDQLEQGEGITEQSEETMPRYICAECGRPYDSLNESTMAGCASCYDAMREDLEKALQDNSHSPEAAPLQEVKEAGQERQEDSLANLRYRLMEAVINERYEEAAGLRDEIKRIQPLGEQT